MPGNKLGGAKAAATNKAKYGSDFFKRIGQKGGSTRTDKPRGFAAMSLERRKELGRIGGRIGGLASPIKKGKQAIVRTADHEQS